MSRLHLAFHCGGLSLRGTLDNAPGTTGLLIVTGGQEPRAGAFGWQARLAAEVAKAGFPVFRFDRRGIGDSEGENRGYEKSRKDIASALRAFRALSPQVNRVVGFGNCDGASALMLAEGAGFDALVLSNPWAIADTSEWLPPAATVRSRYMAKLAKPKEIWRLLSVKVDLDKLASGIRHASGTGQRANPLIAPLREGLSKFDGRVRFLIAENDRTAQVFAADWGPDERVAYCGSAGHAYAEPHAREWLRAQILTALRS